MNDSASASTGIVFDTYLAAIRATFGGEPWVDIESYAQRIWMACCAEDAAWEDIRERVEREWQSPAETTEAR